MKTNILIVFCIGLASSGVSMEANQTLAQFLDAEIVRQYVREAAENVEPTRFELNDWPLTDRERDFLHVHVRPLARLYGELTPSEIMRLKVSLKGLWGLCVKVDPEQHLEEERWAYIFSEKVEMLETLRHLELKAVYEELNTIKVQLCSDELRDVRNAELKDELVRRGEFLVRREQEVFQEIEKAIKSVRDQYRSDRGVENRIYRSGVMTSTRQP